MGHVRLELGTNCAPGMVYVYQQAQDAKHVCASLKQAILVAIGLSVLLPILRTVYVDAILDTPVQLVRYHHAIPRSLHVMESQPCSMPIWIATAVVLHTVLILLHMP